MDVHRFGEAFVSGDIDGMLSTMSPDVTFHSPVIETPGFEGRGAVRVLLEIVVQRFTDRRLVRELRDDGCVALAVTFRVRGKSVGATVLLELDDEGLAREIQVTARPLIGSVAIARAIASGLLGRRHAAMGRGTRVALVPLSVLAGATNTIGSRVIGALNREVRRAPGARTTEA